MKGSKKVQSTKDKKVTCATTINKLVYQSEIFYFQKHVKGLRPVDQQSAKEDTLAVGSTWGILNGTK